MKPCLKLMARSGVPVGKLLAAELRHRGPEPWTWVEYSIAAGLIAVQAVALCWGSAVWLAAFGL